MDIFKKSPFCRTFRHINLLVLCNCFYNKYSRSYLVHVGMYRQGFYRIYSYKFRLPLVLRLRKHIVAVGYVHIDLERPIRGLNLTPGQILSPFSFHHDSSLQLFDALSYSTQSDGLEILYILSTCQEFFFHACRISVSEHDV